MTSARRLVAALTLAAVGILLPASACGFAQVQAKIASPQVGYFRVAEPIPVTVNEKFDQSSLQLSLQPAAGYYTQFTKNGFELRPFSYWKPNTNYTVTVKRIASSDHLSSVSNLKLHFRTQPHTGIAGFLVDGQAITGQPALRPSSHLGIAFTEPMNEGTVKVLMRGQVVDPGKVQWAQDGKSLSLPSVSLMPYQQAVLTIGNAALTAKGDPMTDAPTLNASVLGLAPANSGSGIDQNFKVVAPILVVIDNAQVARPQAGLQDADVVYEYISEYGISRFTLIYFNQPAGTMGPVRSCRMINPYLITQYDGIQMCSGASVGTLHYMFGDGTGLPYLKSSINDFDQGGHFFRVDFKAAPHNLYTDHDKAVRLRSELGVAPATYAVDPGHPDSDVGIAVGPPSVPAHGVSYSYDANSKTYLPFDNGSPRIDTNHGNAQVQVKNLVLMNVPCHDAGWVEDEAGGAHSVWYDMNGTGSADIYMDGKVVHGAWHTGDPSASYFQNNQMPYFTDDSGNFLRLDTGLTWIHVQGSCN